MAACRKILGPCTCSCKLCFCASAKTRYAGHVSPNVTHVLCMPFPCLAFYNMPILLFLRGFSYVDVWGIQVGYMGLRLALHCLMCQMEAWEPQQQQRSQQDIPDPSAVLCIPLYVEEIIWMWLIFLGNSCSPGCFLNFINLDSHPPLFFLMRTLTNERGLLAMGQGNRMWHIIWKQDRLLLLPTG